MARTDHAARENASGGRSLPRSDTEHRGEPKRRFDPWRTVAGRTQGQLPSRPIPVLHRPTVLARARDSAPSRLVRPSSPSAPGRRPRSAAPPRLPRVGSSHDSNGLCSVDRLRGRSRKPCCRKWATAFPQRKQGRRSALEPFVALQLQDCSISSTCRRVTL